MALGDSSRYMRMDLLFADSIPAAVAKASPGDIDFDVFARTITDLRFGKVDYPLSVKLHGHFVPKGIETGGYFRVWEVPSIRGYGGTPEDAYNDWTAAFHRTFQSLLLKRPFEMTQEELNQQRQLTEVVDVASYRAKTPLMVRRFGEVAKVKARKLLVQWEDGSSSKFDLMQSHADAATLKAGDSIDALVAYHPISMRALRLEHVAKRTPSTPLSDEQLNKLFGMMATPDSKTPVKW